ncbi:glycogen synthase GlgA [Occallatibacter savannae]|uniref:glycogen synthase GlgA n=1 Tax=Occallatibacter savannae TaxID=1002691 RepID=UPI000D687FA7|nr:glycogen synthase GlgA [Occallatibacter savannae]
MQIVFAASEAAPFAKTGGLADVVDALSRQIANLGHQVTVFLPLYASVRPLLDKEFNYAVRSITIPFPHGNRFAGIVDGGSRQNVRYYFVDCPEFFDRQGFYGNNGDSYTDNAERFGLFSRAVLEATKILGVPDLFHVHDWQAALLPTLLRTVYSADPLLKNAASVLTIHNAAYQGWFPPATVEQLLLPWEIFTYDKLEQYNTFNFLKGGIVYSDLITTVSPKYAQEIQTAEYGNGLEGALRERIADLRGILNGVDYTEWDPATDGNLAAHYNPLDLSGKRDCRKDLLHAFGLDVSAETPVIGICSRFASQKGFDLLEQIAGRLAERDVAVVALGTGEPHYERFFRDFAFANAARFSVQIRYDYAMAHKIEAGADIFLMPSRFEPCGLNQIYSMKYGTIPVVHATGGLDDTVEEWDPAHDTGVGFKFPEYNAQSLLNAIDRALSAFYDKPQWRKLMENAMAKNFSWESPAAEYVAAYEQAARKRL